MQDQKSYLPDQINEIATALCVFQGDVPEIELDQSVSVQMKTGGSYSFKYASFPNIIKTIKPAMKAAGLSFTQLIDSNGGVLTMLLHSSGQSLQSYINPEAPGTQNDLQKLGSKITYLKRYSLTAILGISAETDDDGNTHQGNTVQKKGEGQQGQQSQREELTDTRADGTEKPWLNQNSEEWKGLVAEVFKKPEPKGGFLAYTRKHFFKVNRETGAYLQNIIDQKAKVEDGDVNDDAIFLGLNEYEAGILKEYRKEVIKNNF